MRRLGYTGLIVIGFALVAAVYVVKTRTQTAHDEAMRLKGDLLREQQAITVLNAEIAHLESPARLSALAAQQLELRPTSVEQVKTLDEAIVGIPRRANVPANVPALDLPAPAPDEGGQND